LGASIRMAVDTGRVVFGSDKARKLALLGKARLVVMARNIPSETRQDLEHYCKLSKIPLFNFDGTSIDLGTACGKPFTVGVFSVLDYGNSDLAEAVKAK